MTQFPIANAMAIGAQKPIVVVNSELVRCSTRRAARRLRARGGAHPLRPPALRHGARDPRALTQTARLPLPLVPIRTALLEWSRAAELCCDRAAALVTRDPLVVCRTLMSLAGGRRSTETRPRRVHEPGPGVHRGGQRPGADHAAADRPRRHARAAGQARARADGVGPLRRLRPHRRRRLPARDDPPRPPREEAADAVSHYSERFKETFKDAGESIEAAGKQLAEWLKRS